MNDGPWLLKLFAGAEYGRRDRRNGKLPVQTVNQLNV